MFVVGTIYIGTAFTPEETSIDFPCKILDLGDSGYATVVAFDPYRRDWADEEEAFEICLDDLSPDRGRSFRMIEELDENL